MSDFERLEWSHTLWDPLEKKSSQSDAHEGPTRVAAYCRVSTHRANGFDSLVNQVSYYTRLMTKQEKWKFVGIYFDQGTSALTTRRPAFQRMLRHCDEGRIDVILTRSLDRVSRNSKDLMETVNLLKALNVSIQFERENIDTLQDYNSLLLSTYAALAQAEAENAAKQTEWAYESRLLKGKPTFKRMYGYDVACSGEDFIVTVNESEAAVVRHIFAMFLEGMGYTDIARELIRQGVKTSKGKRNWHSAYIKKILTSIAYTGNKMARTLTKDLLSRTVRPTNGQRDMFLFENSHPAIISEELFLAAQKRVEEVNQEWSSYRESSTRNASSKPSPLHRRLICGHCGNTYLSSGFYSWRCRSAKSSLDICDAKTVNEKTIKSMILRAWVDLYDFSQPATYQTLLKIIEKVNQNDFFEFHRLGRLTEIEIAYRRVQQGEVEAIKELDRLKEAYTEFEVKVSKIEEDRVYRNAAINWMKELQDTAKFREQITMEHLRAWVKEITVFSRFDYIVHWIDGSESVVGDCTPHPKSIPKGIEKDIGQPSYPPTDGTAPALFHEVEGVVDAVHASTVSDVVKIDPRANVEHREIISRNLQGLIAQRLETTYITVAKEKPVKKILRTAAYCRVSTKSEEQQLSLKTQVAYYTYLILKNPEWEFAGIYVDDGISGTSVEHRKDFLRLMEDCKAGKVDQVICKSLSRFGRDLVSCLDAIRILKSLPEPVHCYFEKENIHTADPESELLISVHASISQEESVNLSASIAWGFRSLAQQGIVRKNYNCYGYDTDEKGNWIVNEEEKKVYLRICQEFLGGKNLSAIARGLYEDRIKSPKGSDYWSVNSLAYMLRNEKYQGDVLYQKTYRPNLTGPRIRNLSQEETQYYIENNHPPLIDPETRQKIKEEFRKREQLQKPSGPKETEGRKSFYRKFYCGACQGLVSRVRNAWNPEESNWRCLNTLNPERPEHCNDFSLTEEYVEQNVMRMLKGIQNDQLFAAKVEAAIGNIELTPEEIQVKERLEDEMDRFNQELYGAVDDQLNQHGRDTKHVEFLTGEIIRRRDELKEFEQRLDKAGKYRTELVWLLREVEGLIESKNGAIPFREDIFERLVAKGTVHPDGRITYCLSVGVEYGISLTRQEFLDQQLSLAKVAEHKALLNSKEVKQMLEYCREPKTFGELYEFLTMRSRSFFRTRIINPLMEKGKLRRIDRKEVGGRHHKYCSV